MRYSTAEVRGLGNQGACVGTELARCFHREDLGCLAVIEVPRGYHAFVFIFNHPSETLRSSIVFHGDAFFLATAVDCADALPSALICNPILSGPEWTLRMTRLSSPPATIPGLKCYNRLSLFNGRIMRRSIVNIKALDVLYIFMSHFILINSFFCITFKLKLSVIFKPGPKPNPRSIHAYFCIKA
jgi:hypothetical protein